MGFAEGRGAGALLKMRWRACCAVRCYWDDAIVVRSFNWLLGVAIGREAFNLEVPAPLGQLAHLDAEILLILDMVFERGDHVVGDCGDILDDSAEVFGTVVTADLVGS